LPTPANTRRLASTQGGKARKPPGAEDEIRGSVPNAQAVNSTQADCVYTQEKARATQGGGRGRKGLEVKGYGG